MKNDNKVTLNEVLDAREKRVSRQKELLGLFEGTLISFLLNIPGPVKTSKEYQNLFYQGVSQIKEKLEEEGMSFTYHRIMECKTGYEFYGVIDGNPMEIKRAMVSVEEAKASGRLYDIDVIDASFHKVSRKEIGKDARKCLLCGKPAHECSRSRNHNLQELLAEISCIIRKEIGDNQIDF